MVIEVEVKVNLGPLERIPRDVAKIPGWTGEVLLSKIDELFDLQQNPWGAPWAPLAPKTIHDKIVHGYPLDILVRTGAMRESLTLSVEKDEAKITIDEPAHFHQFGTNRMPVREIFPVRGGAADLPDQWARDIEEFVLEKMGL